MAGPGWLGWVPASAEDIEGGIVASTELVEATESLAGLAEALRELSPPEA